MISPQSFRFEGFFVFFDQNAVKYILVLYNATMYELPLFPLNIVLFPGMPLPLQVFEERYVEMVELCVREKRPFGVVLIRDGIAERGPLAEPYTVGTTAQITRVEKLDDSGRMIIITLGRERFRIHSLFKDKPYLVGEVEALNLNIGHETRLASETKQLFPYVEEYLEIMSRSGSIEMDASDLPHDPQRFLYLAAAVIQLPLRDKQALLEIDDARELLHILYTYYRQELPVLRMMPSADIGIFSLN